MRITLTATNAAPVGVHATSLRTIQPTTVTPYSCPRRDLKLPQQYQKT